jgi:hypothetical protein
MWDLFVMDKSGAEAGFLWELRFPLPIFIPPISPQSPSPIIRGWHNRPGVAAVPIASQTRIKKKIFLVASFPQRRPGFKPGSGHVGFVVDKVGLGEGFSPSTSVFIPPISPQSPSPIIRGWHNRPGEAAVPIASQKHYSSAFKLLYFFPESI